MIGGACTKCKVGVIMQNSICIKPAMGLDPNCIYYDGAFCSVCAGGFKLVSAMCRKE